MLHTNVSMYNDVRELYLRRVTEVKNQMNSLIAKLQPSDHTVLVIGASLHQKAKTPLDILQTFRENGFKVVFINREKPKKNQTKLIDYAISCRADQFLYALIKVLKIPHSSEEFKRQWKKHCRNLKKEKDTKKRKELHAFNVLKKSAQAQNE